MTRKIEERPYTHFDAAVVDLSYYFDELNDGELQDAIKHQIEQKPHATTGEHTADYKAMRKRVQRLTEEWIMDRRLLS